MAQQDEPQEHSYPTGRGYGNDYLRGGEVLGGYGYSDRPDYERRRGDEFQAAARDAAEERRPRQREA
ncbi:MAG TPA: hypothetical protein VFX39_07380 [Gemmatimonadaceae bacterium]|nr:hypothetical protein [Gemmatimonadaceae bacterium]